MGWGGQSPMPPHSRERFRSMAAMPSTSTTRDVPPTEACEPAGAMFHPGSSGLSEDPATGSATVAAAALLADLTPERDAR